MRFFLSMLFGMFISASVPTIAQTHRQSGNDFLSPEMRQEQNDPSVNPIGLWLDQGNELWVSRCQACHANVKITAQAVVQFPIWKNQTSTSGQVINLEDQISDCLSKKHRQTYASEAPEVLTLAVFLSAAAKGLMIQPREPREAHAQQLWQNQINLGAQIYVQRQGRLNLSCTQCHDQRVGKNLRTDIISPAHLTGFPIYRQSWQTVGSVERRLRACYSGVQASVPLPASQELRALELFLKKRSEGMLWDGPSLRR